MGPYESFKSKIYNINNINEKDLYELEQYFGFSRRTLLFRLKKEGIIGTDWRSYENIIKSGAKKLGYDVKLYEPYRKGQIVLGEYVSLVDKLYSQEKISIGKRNELLSAAFRTNMIF